MKLILVIYFLIVNLIGFLLMLVDKRRAIKKEWRIREKSFFIVAILGGSIGNYLGMYLFRHKTKHLKFTLGMPIIIIIQVYLTSIIIVR